MIEMELITKLNKNLAKTITSVEYRLLLKVFTNISTGSNKINTG